MNCGFHKAALAALALLCAGQAYYIVARRPPAAERLAPGGGDAFADQWRELERGRAGVRERLSKGGPLDHADFDAFFDDAFFGRGESPFAEMERARARLMEALDKTERGAFNAYWDKWFRERMSMDQFRTRTASGAAEVVLTVEIPGLEKDSVKAEANRDRITLSFWSESAAGGESAARDRRGYLKVIPVPGDALGESAKVAVEEGRIRIVFARRRTGS